MIPASKDLERRPRGETVLRVELMERALKSVLSVETLERKAMQT